MWWPELTRSGLALKGWSSCLASAQDVEAGGGPSFPSSVKDSSAISDHAISSELATEISSSDRVLAADCDSSRSGFGQGGRCADGTLFVDRLPVSMGNIDDNTVVKVVIYTIAVICMVLMRCWCCYEMLGMVIVTMESSSVHVPSCCKPSVGFWQVLLQASEVNPVKKPRRKHAQKFSGWQLFVRATIRSLSIRMVSVSVKQPQARPTCVWPSRNSSLCASRIYHDIPMAHHSIISHAP